MVYGPHGSDFEAAPFAFFDNEYMIQTTTYQNLPHPLPPIIFNRRSLLNYLGDQFLDDFFLSQSWLPDYSEEIHLSYLSYTDPHLAILSIRPAPSRVLASLPNIFLWAQQDAKHGYPDVLVMGDGRTRFVRRPIS